MGKLVTSYIALAAQPVGKDAQTMPFPSAFRRLAGSVPSVAVPSEAVPVHPDGDYSDLPHIAGKPCLWLFPACGWPQSV